MLPGKWNEDLVQQLFPEEVCNHIIRKIGVVEDSEEWDRSRIPGTVQEEYNCVWERGIPFKVSFFIWRLWKKRFPIGEFLWKFPNEGVYKCNSDGASKGNPGPSACAFCIRNNRGEFVYAESKGLGIMSSLEAETIALRNGLEYCILHDLLPMILETDSLILKKILDGIWDVPWYNIMEVKRINSLKDGKEVEIEHTFREVNMIYRA
ncbi:hypothetical protein KY290_017253 [Solanum tuberosum]|uniref:RNase H family protein n=1 Tax=Solanum tuberosum TaxID=4113 RepID=A0ABQ7VAS4_SOLTU|nr:hypothetical protein KY284_016278 [Solanum tuberosum]KAH0702010.1 hypothetical protein KY285_016288 [Solanum tuberosum]KAH0761180.1 hypothetical protein KY290_017253 [Solanum tuberosum]